MVLKAVLAAKVPQYANGGGTNIMAVLSTPYSETEQSVGYNGSPAADKRQQRGPLKATTTTFAITTNIGTQPRLHVLNWIYAVRSTSGTVYWFTRITGGFGRGSRVGGTGGRGWMAAQAA